MRRFTSLGIAVVLLLGLGMTPANAARGQETPPLPTNCTVVASDLLNPRFVAVAEDGTLFVSEAGVAGEEELFLPEEFAEAFGEAAAPAVEGAATPVASPVVPAAFGFRGGSGQVTMVAPDGTQTVLVSGLPSYAFGPETIGPAGIAVADGAVWLAVGGAGPLTPFLDPLAMENAVVRINPATGEVTQVADVGAYERANDPEPFAIDSNLYGLDVAADGALIVADAGGNTVYRVDPDSGELSLLAVIPGVPPPAGFAAPEDGNPLRGGALELDPVPTGVAVAADGSILVGQLGSLVTDAGQVVQLAADGALGEIVSGLTNVVDVKVGPDGVRYVSEISTDFEAEIPAPGAVVRLAADGTPETVLADLPFPNGLAFAGDGALYVVINTVSFGPPQGQVLRCELESAAAPPDVQTIELRDFAFSPSTITIPADTEVTLRLVNRGFAVHDLTIADLGITSPTIRPGRSATVVVTAAPGTYRIACSVPGHLAHGMVGTVQAMTG